jgi:NAD(P)-dependent dehydrogenase (short-subunit alcohol dehydrogenase family)
LDHDHNPSACDFSKASADATGQQDPLITGENSGIGLAKARLFAAASARVAIMGRDRKKLDDAVALVAERTIAIQADVTDIKALKRGVADAEGTGAT